MKLRLTCPPRELSPNNLRRVHHMKRASLVKCHRRTVAIEALGGLRGGARPRWVEARVRVTIYHRQASYFLDPDNALAWMKSVFDGLTAAGIFADDRRLTHLPIRQEAYALLAGKVDVEIDPSIEELAR